MSSESDIRFIKDDAIKHLEQFTDEVRSSKSETAWRCLYAALDPDITKDPARKNIAEEFLKSSFKNTFEVKAFWLVTGHLFIFFQGPVRKIIKDYESFLNTLSEDNKQIEYHFFWKLDEFWGYFDQVLARVIEEKPSPEISETPSKKTSKKGRIDGITEELHRQRQARYKPLLLIVEDDRVTRHFLQAIMEKYCDIAVAWNAEQAREFYKSMLPNITFLDIELPDGDGQELAELFCSHDPESFVVMVSGALDDAKIERCFRAGVKGTVSKPAGEAPLLKFIDQYNKTQRKHEASG